jgi:hypothetical protein
VKNDELQSFLAIAAAKYTKTTFQSKLPASSLFLISNPTGQTGSTGHNPSDRFPNPKKNRNQ